MTNQTQLNTDCMFAVVDQMDFETLLAMAQTNQINFIISLKSFKRRFAHRVIVIENNSAIKYSKIVHDGMTMLKKIKNRISSVEPPNKPQIEIMNENIRIKIVHDALRTLRTFGNAIQNLRLKLTNADTIESIAILRYVDKYCTDSLTELALDIGTANALRHFSKPFVKVEHVTFMDKLPSAEGQSIPINKLFPSLRSLTLNIDSAKDNNYLTEHFPHLEHLNIQDIPYDIDGEDSPACVYGLLEKNPQIRNISLDRYIAGVLKKISLMPQLEHFSFLWFEPIIGENRFQNVTKFTSGDHIFADPTNLLFPKLYELELFFYASNFDNWMAFMVNHINLKRLRLHIINFEDGQFTSLASILRHLEEMSLYLQSGREHEPSIGVEAIIKFIENHEKLVKLHLDTISETDKIILRSKFLREWNINECGDGLSLERKSRRTIE